MPRPLPHEREGAVLLPGSDHDFYVGRLDTVKVVYNPVAGMYFEYHRDQCLDVDDGEYVVEALVAG